MKKKEFNAENTETAESTEKRSIGEGSGCGEKTTRRQPSAPLRAS
jgi:hypothetical protein